MQDMPRRNSDSFSCDGGLLFDAKSYFIAVISRVRYSWTRLIVGVAQFWRSVSQDHLLKVEDTFIR